tara:strand:- start:280 stop:426 length:147 start_codon:yes stop_codon:yes gene_type:complete
MDPEAVTEGAIMENTRRERIRIGGNLEFSVINCARLESGMEPDRQQSI